MIQSVVPLWHPQQRVVFLVQQITSVVTFFFSYHNSFPFLSLFECHCIRPPTPTPEGEAPADGGLTDADFDSNWDEAIETFDAMDLPEELLRGIYSYGFEKPSAIQQRAIKPAMMGHDLIAQAQSGTVSNFEILDFRICRRDDDFMSNTIFRV